MNGPRKILKGPFWMADAPVIPRGIVAKIRWVIDHHPWIWLLVGVEQFSTDHILGGVIFLIVFVVNLFVYEMWEHFSQLAKRIMGRTTVAASLPTLQAGLYVSDIRFTFADLKDRHSELTMRVFNGAGRDAEFSGLITGRIKFSAPNNSDPSRMGDFPTPAMRPDTERTVAQLKEGLLILTQIVPAVEADKLIAMLETDTQINFDLRELTIGVFAQDDRNKIERLPIWSGVSYSRGNGFGMINYVYLQAIGRG
jgi:hypothetical protein